MRASLFLAVLVVSACGGTFKSTDGDGDHPDSGLESGSGGGSGVGGDRNPNGGGAGTGGKGSVMGSGGVHSTAGMGAGSHTSSVDGGTVTVDASEPVDGETDAGVDGEPPAPHCPTNLPGPALVQITAPDGSTYCIDSTEVTNADYAAFLAASSSLPNPGANCAWNDSLVPRDSWPTGRDDFPVISVDWCDADTYCKWAGKKLCGKISGGPNMLADYKYAKFDAWFNACSQGGQRGYPYGSTYDATACNGGDKGLSDSLAVASEPECVGGVAGLFDMSGNVAEWEDSCTDNDPDPGHDLCRLRGGAWSNTPAEELRCDMAATTYRNFWYHYAGIRCCADAE
jgi:hypothetical protein